MKKTILLICLCISFSTTLFSQNSDKNLIEKTVSYYLEGGTNNDFETLKKAFHKDATMKFMKGNEYTDVNALEFFKKAIKPGPKQNRTTKIVSIDVTGNAAQAKLKIEYSTFAFIDYMNLLKVDGEWKIVNKIFYRKNKSNN